MRQQGCSCFHLSRANSLARVPGQQHYKFCNKCRVNIAREAKGRAVPGHLCSLDSWVGSWMLTASARAALPLGDTHQAGGCCRFHLPGLGGAAALFLDAGANTTRPRRGPLYYQATTTSTAAALLSSRIQPGQQGCSRSHSSRASSWPHEATGPRLFYPPGSSEQHHQAGGCSSWMLAQHSQHRRGSRVTSWMLTASARAALPSGDTNQHRRGSRIQRGQHQPGGRGSWGSLQPRQLGGFPG